MDEECLDMEIVIGEEPFQVTIYRHSDLKKLVQELVRYQNLPENMAQ